MIKQGQLNSGVTGLIQLNGNVEFDLGAQVITKIPSGKMQVIDTNGIVKEVSWNEYLNVVPIALTAAGAMNSYILIDINGDLQQQTIPPSPKDWGTKFPFLLVSHVYPEGVEDPNYKFIVDVESTYLKVTKNIAEYAYQSLYFPAVLITKYVKVIAGGNDLTLGLSRVNPNIKGEARLIGAGYDGLNNFIDIEDTPTFGIFFAAYRKIDDTVISYPKIYPDNIIDNVRYNSFATGTLETIPDNRPWIVHRIFYFPKGNTFLFSYGIKTYETKLDAQINYQNEDYNILRNKQMYLNTAILLAYLIIKKGVTNLNNLEEAQFINAFELSGQEMINNVNSSLISGGILTDAGGVTFTYNNGRVFDIKNNIPKIFDGSSSPITLTNNVVNFVYWSSSTQNIAVSTTSPIQDPSTENQLVGFLSCQGGDIVEAFQTPTTKKCLSTLINVLSTIFPMVVIPNPATQPKALIILPNPQPSYPLAIKMTAGKYILFLQNIHIVTDILSHITPIVRHYKVSAVWTSSSSQEVDTLNYQNGDNLATIPPNKYSYVIFYEQDEPSSGIYKIAMVYAPAYYNNISDAEAALRAIKTTQFTNLPPGFTYNVRSYGLAFQQAQATLPIETSTNWVDLRPIFTFQ